MTEEIERPERYANREDITAPNRLAAIDQIYELRGIRKIPTWESLE